MLMRCEQCGAPQEVEADQKTVDCRYCGKRNWVIHPELKARMEAMKLAAEAAQQRGVAAVGNDEPALCPACGMGLVGGRALSCTIYGCGNCGGVWLDGAASAEFAKDPHPTLVEMAKRAAANAARPGGDVQERRPCPVCAQLMKRTQYADNHFTLDACARHGTWFDPGELPKVATKIRIQVSARSANPLSAKIDRYDANHYRALTGEDEFEWFRQAVRRQPERADQPLVDAGAALISAFLR